MIPIVQEDAKDLYTLNVCKHITKFANGTLLETFNLDYEFNTDRLKKMFFVLWRHSIRIGTHESTQSYD